MVGRFAAGARTTHRAGSEELSVTSGGSAVSTGFAGQVAVVAGGTGGLGRAVSLAFLDEGATVVVTYRTQTEFDALVRAAAVNAAHLEGHRIDVTDDHEVHQFVEGIAAQHGRLDALVNTVGGYVGGAKLWDLDPKDFERMLAMNLRSGYALSRAIVPVMLKQAGGSIINIAAKAGVDHPAGAAA